MKTVIVTGSSRGIGLAICRKFLEEGWEVVGLSRSGDVSGLKDCDGFSSRFTNVRADVTKKTDLDSFFTRFGTDGRHVDALVNNAGVSYIGLLQDMTENQWDTLMDTNLKGAFLCTQYALRDMIPRQSGSIINISSMWGTEGASCEVAYSASKGGLNLFTRALAKETAPSHITVNAITCGVIDTSMNGFLSPGEKEDLIGQIGMGRMGTPQEVAELAFFLASDKARYLTGALIPLDGGFTG